MNAFPSTQYLTGISPSGHSEGMSLRDYLAAKAITTVNWYDVEASAKQCYRIADALIKARAQDEG